MPPNPKVREAFRAMKCLGVTEDKVKPVLKNLLKVYEKNWEMIEAESYRVLADAIFEAEEAEIEEQKKKSVEELSEAVANEEAERPLKRLRLRHQEAQSPLSADNFNSNVPGTSLIKPKVEPDEVPQRCSPTENLSDGIAELTQSQAGKMRTNSQSVASQPLDINKGKYPVSPKPLTLQERPDLSQEGRPNISQPTPTMREISSSVSHPMRLRDRRKETDNPPNVCVEKTSKRPQSSSQTIHIEVPKNNLILPKEKAPVSHALIKPKEEPLIDDFPHLEAPMPPLSQDPASKDSLNENGSNGGPESPAPSTSQAIGENSETSGVLVKGKGESSSKLVIASTPCGKVKIYLSYDLACQQPDFSEPSIAAVLEKVKENYLKTNDVFSPKEMMKGVCECFLELGNGSGLLETESNSQAPLHKMMPNLSPCNDTKDYAEPAKSAPTEKFDKGNDQEDMGQSNCQSLVMKESEPNWIGSQADVIDITKGQEMVIVSLENQVNNERPPSFHYIPQNAIFQHAYVNFSLARIGDNCCSSCLNDCLSMSAPCACANEMGGTFAYTREGLVKEDFLEDCISMNHAPEKHCMYFCKECPLERAKSEEFIEPCKGHLVSKFIKECWLKCGCSKQCGNRVVQRGISRRLQVFMTPEGKGWGLRTLEDLPKGAFVCEYVGEVLTNAELFDRVEQRRRKGEVHSYPVLLDADWGAEGVLKDEEALCLDATKYGNVARFINHRCLDSNMVEIPVEIETPDHHYYHLAFFTSRKVEAMEELTWDYGIDFDDIDHPVKAFPCHCGSKFCRNIKRTRRSRSSARR